MTLPNLKQKKLFESGLPRYDFLSVGEASLFRAGVLCSQKMAFNVENLFVIRGETLKPNYGARILCFSGKFKGINVHFTKSIHIHAVVDVDSLSLCPDEQFATHIKQSVQIHEMTKALRRHLNLFINKDLRVDSYPIVDGLPRIQIVCSAHSTRPKKYQFVIFRVPPSL